MNQPKEEILSGSIEGIVFRNEDTGFTVLDMDCGDELICVVGQFNQLNVGEEIEVHGSFVNHPSFGRQFKASFLTTKLPATAGAIYKYLSGGAIKGIGPATARRLVDTFGNHTLEIIEKDPLQLCKIKGISKSKAENIAIEYRRIFGVRQVMMFLSEFGLTPAESIRVYKVFGDFTKELVTQNPYMLMGDSIGIAFDRIDRIAIELGFEAADPARIRAAIIYILKHNMGNGHTCLPREKLLQVTCGFIECDRDTVDELLSQMIEEDYVKLYYVGGSPMIYLPELYRAEEYIAARLCMIDAYMPDTGVDFESKVLAQEKALGITYAPEQRDAICAAGRRGLVVLTGGPGTGKTTTINGMISLFENQGKKVMLAAPTGRAAKRMSTLTGREAKTIHRLLEVGYGTDGNLCFAKNDDDLLNCDVVIVDEVSMVDVLLFEALLRAMKMTCKLVLVGDYNQLPSVGPGNLLKNIIDCEQFHVVFLRHIFRQAAQSHIVVSAHEILSGEVPDLSQKEGDLFFMSTQNKKAGIGLICDLISTRLPKAYGVSTDQIQILSPGRKGFAGSEQLNRALRERLNPEDKSKNEVNIMGIVFREGDKVMQIKNNYDIVFTQGANRGTGIFNGDMGTIEKIDKKSGLIQLDFEGKLCTYTFDMAAELEHAYAVTVHKSQGSEFDIVILNLLEPNPKLYFRNLLYTAVTRAKQLLVVVGAPGAVEMMVENNRKQLRYGGLEEMIHEGIR